MEARLSRKLHALMDMPTDSPDLVRSLDYLGNVYGENTADARRGLRTLLEQQHLQNSRKMVEAFKPTQQKLATIGQAVKALSTSCDSIGSSIQFAKVHTDALLSESERLVQDKMRLAVRREVVGCFLTKFQLSEAEEITLKSGNIDAAFLGALDRLKQIRLDCSALLRTQHQRAGLELMDVMGYFQEAAFERLYRWVQRVVKNIDEHAADTQFMHAAVTALRERPVLFRHCIEEMGKSRRASIMQKFLCALTQGGPGGMPRPIELTAHDPMRYVGDMVAWLHQTLAEEEELLRAVLGDIVEELAPPPTERGDEAAGGDGELAPPSLRQRVLDSAFQAVCRPFRVRVEQTLATQPDGATAYKLANLLEFYAKTIEGLLTPTAMLPKVVTVCKQQAIEAFFSSWARQNDRLLAYPPPLPADLSVSPAVQDATVRLVEIAELFSASLTPEVDREAQFSPIVQAAIDPALKVCYLGAESTDESSLSVHMINNISCIQSALIKYEVFTTGRFEMLKAQLEAHVEALISNQASQMLTACGLAQVYTLAQKQPAGASTPLVSLPGCGEEQMVAAFGSFFRVIFSADAGATNGDDLMAAVWSTHGSTLSAKIESPRVRETVRAQISLAIRQTYDELYHLLHDKKNGYVNPGSIAVHTPEELRLVL